MPKPHTICFDNIWVILVTDIQYIFVKVNAKIPPTKQSCLSQLCSIKCSLTFELDLQHLIGILDDVTVWPESVAGTMHADLQAKICLWGGRGQEHRDVRNSHFFPWGHYPSSQLNQDSLVRCATMYDGRKIWGVVLTSVHQPLPHGLSNIKGDPLRRSFGKYVLAPNVALFGFRVVFLKDLRGKMKMWPSCINSLSFTHTHRTRDVCLSQTLQDALGQMSTPNGKSDSQCWYPRFAS